MRTLEFNSPDFWPITLRTYLRIKKKSQIRFVEFSNTKEVEIIEGSTGISGLLVKTNSQKMGKLYLLKEKVEVAIVKINLKEKQGDLVLLIKLGEERVKLMKQQGSWINDFGEKKSIFGRATLCYEKNEVLSPNLDYWDMQSVKRPRVLWNISKSDNFIGGFFRRETQKFDELQ